jgi:spore germination protein KB
MFFTIGTTILIIPAGLAADSKQDAWIAAIIGVGLGMLLTLFYNHVSKFFPNMTIVQYSENLFGRWIGKTISLLFVFFSFIGATTLLFYMGNFMTVQIMSETPIEYINILFASIVILGIRLGLETLSRAAEIFFPWFVFLFLMLAVLICPQIDFEHVQPVLETGIKPLFKGALTLAATASLTYIVLFMIFPAHVNNPAKARKAFLQATLIGGIFITLITFLCISVLGPDTVARNAYPSYSLARKISIGNFVERIEIIMAGLWFISIYFKMTLYFYACVVGLAQVLNLRDYRPLSLPLGMLLIVYSLIVYPNSNYMAKWDSTIFIPYVLSFGLLLPLLFWIVSIIKNKF